MSEKNTDANVRVRSNGFRLQVGASVANATIEGELK